MNDKLTALTGNRDVASDSRRRRIVFVILVAAVLLAAAGAAGVFRARLAAAPDARPVYSLRRGPLVISVTEPGAVNALDQIEIKSEVEGQAQILYLIGEGQIVEAGELLVELDASRLNDNLVDQQIRVHNADAAFIRARENLAVTRNQTEADISKAELDLRFAREDRVKYEQGDYPKQLLELESRITLAREELEQASQTLEWSQALFDEQYISKTELERDRLSHQRAGLDYTLAKANLELMRNYTHQRRLDELRANVAQSEMALERVRLRAGADIVQAQADLRAREAEFERQRERLERTADQIAKTRIYAPRRGMVVYGTTGQTRWHSGEPLEEGQQVRERQTLIYLPSPGRMRIDVQVHESALDSIAPGQLARITLDALPGREYYGRVVRIAPLPDGATRWMNPDLKVYRTQINLDGEAVGLRTGMSCRAEIIIEEYDDVLAVPIQSVIRVNGQPTVYVQTGRGFEPRAIEVGLDNNRMVHVLDGLAENEVVSLMPPLEAGATPTLRAPPPAAAAAEPSVEPATLLEAAGDAASDRTARPPESAGERDQSGAPDTGSGRQGGRPARQ